MPIREVSNLGDKNLFRIVTTQNVIEQIAVDDPFAMIARYNGCSTYSVNQCRQITFLNNIHYAGPAGSFGLRESTGISIVNCKIQQKKIGLSVRMQIVYTSLHLMKALGLKVVCLRDRWMMQLI